MSSPTIPASAAGGSTFVLAHLSDPHLTSLRGVRPWSLCNKRILGYLSWRAGRRREHRPEVLEALVADLRRHHFDHLAITGDLTQLGLSAEFRQARHWLEELGPADRVSVVPGNHDAYVKMPVDSTLALWREYMVSDADAAPRSVAAVPGGVFPSLRKRDSIALIGVSSACASGPFLATGRLGAKQLQALDGILEQTGRQGLARVLSIHHLPRRGSYKWRKRLTDADALERVLKRRGVELVLHGHSHRFSLGSIVTNTGRAAVVGVPSASSFGAHGHPAGYYLYHLAREPKGWRLRMEGRAYDPERGGFRALPEQILHLS